MWVEGEEKGESHVKRRKLGELQVSSGADFTRLWKAKIRGSFKFGSWGPCRSKERMIRSCGAAGISGLVL
jgi:hypothetical protein